MLQVPQAGGFEFFIIVHHAICISSLYQLPACYEEVKGATNAEKISFKNIIYWKFDGISRGEELAEASEFQDHWVYITRCAYQPGQ